MVSTRTKLHIILFTMFVDMVGFGIVIPVLPIYVIQFGATEAVNGWLVGSFSAAQLLAAPLLGRLSDRVGRRPVLFFSLLGTAIGFFLMGWAGTLWLLFVARIIDGASGGNIATAQAYIADVTTPAERSKAMGLVGAAFGMGFVVGPALGGLLSGISTGAPFFFAGGLALLNAGLVFLFLPESLPKEDRAKPHVHASFREVLRHGRQLPVLLLCYFLAITGFSILTVNYALFTYHRFGYGTMENGYLFAFIGAIAAIVQGLMIRWVLRRWSERTTVIGGGLLLAASLALLPYSAELGSLLFFSGLISMGNGLMMPPLNGLISLSSDRGWQGKVFGVMHSAGGVGRLVGPVLGGWLLSIDSANSETYGRTPFWIGALLVLAAVVCMLQIPSSPTSIPSEA